MANRGFDYYIERILSHEGGYVNNPADPGGETKWGISKRSYPNVNIKALTREDAIEIYRKDFWNRVQGENLPTALAFQALDAAVNSGIGNAVRFLQRALGVADDGVVGPITLARLRSHSEWDVTALYIAERLEFMTKLNTWQTFGKGWARRIAGNIRYAAEDTDG